MKFFKTSLLFTLVLSLGYADFADASLGGILTRIFRRSARTADETPTPANPRGVQQGADMQSEMARGGSGDSGFNINRALREMDAFAGYRGGEITVASVTSKLMRETKAAAVVVAPAGAGKSEFWRHMKHLIDTEHPSVRPLHGNEMVYLDPKSLMGNTAHRGDFEGRLDQLVRYLENPQNRGKILVIDELEELFKSGDMGIQFLDALKPYLTSNMPVKLAFGITPAPYRQHMTDPQIVRRIQAVHFSPPNDDVVRLILRGVQRSIELDEGMRFTPDQIEGVLRISRQSRLANPDASLTILENAKNLARVALGSESLDVTRIRARLREVNGEIERIQELRHQGAERAFGPHFDSELSRLHNEAESFGAALRAYDEAFADTQAWRDELEQLIRQRATARRSQADNATYDVVGDFNPHSIDMDQRINELSQMIGDRTRVLQNLNVTDEQIIRAAVDQLQLDEAVVRSAWNGASVTHQAVNRIVGDLHGQHQEIVSAIANSVRVRRALSGDRQADIPAFLVLGPQSGEVEAIARAAAREFTGLDPYRIDGSSIRSEANMTRHLGADPGYVGYREGTPGPFLEFTQRANGNVGVVFSHIDQGDNAVRDLLTSLLQNRSYTANTGEVVDFSNSIIFASMRGYDDNARRALAEQLNGVTDEMQRQVILRNYVLSNQQGDRLSPELLNRMQIIHTDNTGSLRLQSAIYERLNSRSLRQALSENLEISLNYTDDFIADLARVLSREGGDQQINEVIRYHLIPFLQRHMDSGDIVAGDVVTLGINRSGDYEVGVSAWANGSQRARVVGAVRSGEGVSREGIDAAADFLEEALRILD
jgi:ATP-dependent Clp protease ATP-binding subunit ClpA